MRKIFNNRGSALLVAILVMGVLLAVSLVLSNLILRELVVSGKMLDAAKAYYASESGLEHALYELNHELPGWEPEDGVLGSLNKEELSYKVTVANRCKSFPCVDDVDLKALSKAEDDVLQRALYSKLTLNDTVTIPLFVVGDREVEAVKNFVVQFYAGFEPGELLLKGRGQYGLDVLRWKLFGMKKVEGDFLTDSINDFTAVSVTNEGKPSSPLQPSWFGSQSCGNDGLIECLSYTLPNIAAADGKLCSNLQARDTYVYDENGREVRNLQSCYPISTFMSEHQTPQATGLNYLTLTNLVNPSLLKAGASDDLYFRVETFGDEVVREVAEITADGFYGSSKQSIQMSKRRGSPLPVLNFSIYSTE